MAECCDPEEDEPWEVKLAAERSTNEGEEEEGCCGAAACPLDENSGGGGGGGGRCGAGGERERAAEAKACTEELPRNALLDRRVAPRSGTAAPAEAQSAASFFFPPVGIFFFFARSKGKKKRDGGLCLKIKSQAEPPRARSCFISLERAREDLLSDSEDAFFLRGRRAPREKKEGRGRRRQRRKERATHAAADPRRESRED